MLKVLGAIARDPGEWQTVYSVSKRTGINNSCVRDNLEVLVRLGWAEKYGGGIIRKYRLNSDNRRAKLFQEYLSEIEYFS